MIKKTVKYTNFNNEEVTEDLFFHMSKANMIRLQLEYGNEDIDKIIDKAIKQKDNKTILQFFDKIIELSYGTKTEDGRSFLQRKEDHEKFVSSIAYDEFLMGMLQNTEEATEFINGLFPADIVASLDKEKLKLENKENSNISLISTNPNVTPNS